MTQEENTIIIVEQGQFQSTQQIVFLTDLRQRCKAHQKENVSLFWFKKKEKKKAEFMSEYNATTLKYNPLSYSTVYGLKEPKLNVKSVIAFL